MTGKGANGEARRGHETGKAEARKIEMRLDRRRGKEGNFTEILYSHCDSKPDRKFQPKSARARPVYVLRCFLNLVGNTLRDCMRVKVATCPASSQWQIIGQS